jgi:hypothetical protein
MSADPTITATAPATPAPLLTLEYATLPECFGIEIADDGYRSLLHVPPAPSWRFLPRGLLAATAVFCAMTAVTVLWPLTRPRVPWPVVLVNASFYGLGAAALLVVAYVRRFQSRTFIVTADRVIVHLHTPLLGQDVTHWDRAGVRGAAFDRAGNKLHLHLAGDREPVRLPVSPDPDVTRYVVGQLIVALGRRHAPWPGRSLAPTPADETAVGSPRRTRTPAALGAMTLLGATFVVSRGAAVAAVTAVVAVVAIRAVRGRLGRRCRSALGRG